MPSATRTRLASAAAGDPGSTGRELGAQRVGQPLADPCRAARVAVAALLDDALDHAVDEGHAAGLDHLQVDRGQQVRAVAASGERVGDQVAQPPARRTPVTARRRPRTASVALEQLGDGRGDAGTGRARRRRRRATGRGPPVSGSQTRPTSTAAGRVHRQDPRSRTRRGRAWRGRVTVRPARPLPLTVDPCGDAPGVGLPERRREPVVGEALVGHRTHEPAGRGRPDRRRPADGGRRVGATVVLGVAHRHAGGPARSRSGRPARADQARRRASDTSSSGSLWRVAVSWPAEQPRPPRPAPTRRRTARRRWPGRTSPRAGCRGRCRTLAHGRVQHGGCGCVAVAPGDQHVDVGYAPTSSDGPSGSPAAQLRRQHRRRRRRRHGGAQLGDGRRRPGSGTKSRPGLGAELAHARA